MANILAKNASGTTVEIKATGAGSTGDPHIPEQFVKASVGVVTAQSVAFTGTSAQSAAWNSGTTRVVLVATADCWAAFGASPTAVAAAAGAVFVPAGVYGYPITITAGQKLAVVQASAAGTICIIEAA